MSSSQTNTELENFPAIVKRLDQIKSDIVNNRKIVKYPKNNCYTNKTIQIDGLHHKNHTLEEQVALTYLFTILKPYF